MLKFLFVAMLFASAYAGIVSPINNCGSRGLHLQLRVTDCTLPPCRLVAGVVYLIEEDFVPSADSAVLGLRLTLILASNIAIPIMDVEAPDSAVVGGETYTISYPLTPNDGLNGIQFDLELEIYDVATARLEICISAAAVIV